MYLECDVDTRNGVYFLSHSDIFFSCREILPRVRLPPHQIDR